MPVIPPPSVRLKTVVVLSFCLLIAIFLVSGVRPSSASAAAVLGTNLIVNPGAEVGTAGDGTGDPPPDWTVTGDLTQILYSEGDGYPTVSTPGPPSPGTAFFGGGYPSGQPSGGVGSTATQTISISGLGAQVDAGTVGYDLSGWLGGYLSDGDDMEVVLTFANASGAVLGTGHIGPVTAAMRADTTELLSAASSGAIPEGTRSIQVEMISDWLSGASDDGYADDLSLVLAAISKPTEVTVTQPAGQSATVGTPFDLPISAADSDSTQSLTYAAGGLPAGLSISASTGEITGVPQAAETSTVTVRATDTTGSMGSTTFSIATTQAPGDLSVSATITPPVATGQSGWYTGPVTVTPTTTGQDGAVQVNAAVDGAAPVIVTAPLQIMGDGTHTVTLTATDAEGGIASPDTFALKIDATPPSSTATFDSASQAVQITASDATSGVALIQYQLNGGAWTTASAGTTMASVPAGAGPSTIGFRAIDNAGNVEAAQSLLLAGPTTPAPAPPPPPALPSPLSPLAASDIAVVAPATLAYGHTGAATVTVTDSSGTPSGTITLRAGTRVLGTFALSDGSVQVPLPKTMIVGKHLLSAAYSGDAGAAASTSTTRLVRVTRSAARLDATAKVSSGRLGVTVVAVVPGTTVVAPGQVTLMLTGPGLPHGRLLRGRLFSGHVAVQFGHVTPGSYRLTVRLPESATVQAGQTSRQLQVRL